MAVTLEDIKLINAGLVDSRIKGIKKETHATLPLEKAYCIFCGRAGGYTSMESAEFIRANNVIYVCDDCVLTNGEPPLIKAPVTEIKNG